MPFTKFRRFNRPNRKPRVYRKRAPGKVYKKRYVKKNAQKGKQVFPSYLQRKLTFSKVGETTVSWPSINSNNVFRANDLYDPDAAIGGNQPRYFDTLCGGDGTSAPYKKFIVTGCKITYTGVCLSAVPIYAYVGMRNSSKGAPSSLPEILEREGYKYRVCSNSSSPNRFVLSMYRPMNQFFGVSRKGYIEETALYSGDNATSPTEQVSADCGFYNGWLTGAGNVSVAWTVKVTYYVRFFERNDVADS